MLEIGTKAPDFSLPDQNGEIHSLEEYKGKKVNFIFLSKRQYRRLYNAGLWFCRAISSVLRKKCCGFRGKQGQCCFT